MTQMTLEAVNHLTEAFVAPGSKTLKIEPKQGTTLMECVKNAYHYLEQWPFHTKVEFKYGRFYIVIARLKD